MQVKAIATNQYPGDTFKRIEVDGRTVFGIYRERGMWKNDTLSGYSYDTITEAKAHAASTQQEVGK